jgi:hypothetical protein
MSLRFTATDVSTDDTNLLPSPRGSRNHHGTLRQYSCQHTGPLAARTCVVPAEGNARNQTVFIRGFTLAVNERLFGKSAQVSAIIDMKPSDLLRKGASYPGVSRPSTFGTWLFGRFLFSRHNVGNSQRTVDPGITRDADVITTEFPKLSEVKLIEICSARPDSNRVARCTILRKSSVCIFCRRSVFFFLSFSLSWLNAIQNTDAQSVIIHDDVWRSVVTEVRCCVKSFIHCLMSHCLEERHECP